MIEVKDLYKTYRPRRGVPVRALGGVSLTLPDTGMVFLLGKSGSGKSTLLNLLGGLDRYDSGDIVVNGTSTRKFRQVHFDSYRNTYVGFIFQEYNLLDEFTVGANIALAIELQGRRARNEEINAILQEVDLVGYGNRRTNELSGGQKQRVAIARALVKRPDIIMADEPSGALDAATGRAVFDTLKKLSAERLVLVVSHDREFAEAYGDRIIELADGHVIDDRTLVAEAGEETHGALVYTDEAIEIPADYELTEEDRAAINAYLRARRGGKLHVTAPASRFVETAAAAPADGESAPSAAAEGERKTHATFRLIRSRLPLRSAFRIGGSALGHKRVRLVFTILLSVVAFILFGLSDTIASYDPVRTMTSSLLDSGVRYASLGKTDYIAPSLTEEEITALRQDTGLPFVGVYAPQNSWNLTLTDSLDTKSDGYAALGNLTVDRFSGFAELDEADMRDMHYTLLSGHYPDGAKNEIAVSLLIYEQYRAAGYLAPGADATVPITSPDNLVGKTLVLGDGEAYTICGVFDSGFDFAHYALLQGKMEEMDSEEMLAAFILLNEFSYEAGYGFSGAACVGAGFLDRYLTLHPHVPSMHPMLHFRVGEDEHLPLYPEVAMDDTHLPNNITWLDGKARTTLAPGELVVPSLFDFDYMEKEEETGEFTYWQDNAQIEVVAWDDESFDFVTQGRYTIVGYYDLKEGKGESILYCSAGDLATFVPDTGIYAYAAAAMPSDRAGVERLVRYARDGETRYELQNGVSYQISIASSILEILGGVFLYVGIGFAIFAALLFSNFVANSVIYKRREIGILRAIGSRSRDVFCIFFSESFIIAMINFALSALGTAMLSVWINHLIRENSGVLVTLLTFSFRQVLLLFAISVGVALLASFLPVRRIAAKRPIDAIRER